MIASLEDILIQAADGDPLATEQFLRSFLESRIFVPDRYGNPAPHNAAPYPSDLCSLLALQEDARIIVPCFISKEHARVWSPQVTNFSELSAKTLLERMPDDWWLVLNPGAEASKEFTPWEIRKLKGGLSALPEVVADISQAIRHSGIEVRPLEISEAPEIITACIEYTARHTPIHELYAAMETSHSEEQEPQSCILIGLLVSSGDGGTYARELLSILEHKSIGDYPVRVIGSPARDSLQFSVFAQSTPLWRRLPWWKRFLSVALGRRD